MSRLSDLLQQVARLDPALGADLGREVKALSSRRAFGLNFERHQPESVEMPGRQVRRGDKVRILPPRGAVGHGDGRLWQVVRVSEGTATLVELVSSGDAERCAQPVSDLVVVAEFRDPIFPGLVSTGRVERGGDKPFHTVINAENCHALEALTYTHEGKVDAIYIDPPYNTGSRDWKYNNDYVDSDDAYRHSKWLAFMERRLKLAKRLLNPDNSVLIVTIDEKEYLRLGLLLQQTFPEATHQMVSVTINPKGTSRPRQFSRVDEFLYVVLLGEASVPDVRGGADAGTAVRWRYLRREDDGSFRGTRPRQFYPVFVDPTGPRIVGAGDPVPLGVDRSTVQPPVGAVAVFPVREDGVEMEWGLTAPSLLKAAADGFVRVTPGHANQPFIVSYLTAPNIRRLHDGDLQVIGVRSDGSKIVVAPAGKATRPKTVWQESRHSAGDYGTKLLTGLLSGRRFPFPKSLYAVEDTLRFFVADKPEAVVLDFFSGSGTTAHAVMRLNKQDGGRRQCISVTNNEVSADEQKKLRAEGLRPGDPDWERWGICDYITKPRIRAAIEGRTPEGEPIKGDYKFTDEFPMADGFEENAEFFTLTYEAPRTVAHHKSFEAIAPLLWLRAGATGRRIDEPKRTFDVADTYGVLFDVDAAGDFLDALVSTGSTTGGRRIAYVVTDDERAFQMVCADLPEQIEPVRLYESYLTSFTLGGSE